MGLKYFISKFITPVSTVSNSMPLETFLDFKNKYTHKNTIESYSDLYGVPICKALDTIYRVILKNFFTQFRSSLSFSTSTSIGFISLLVYFFLFPLNCSWWFAGYIIYYPAYSFYFVYHSI